MDRGERNYRRYLDGDDDGIVAIIEEYKDGLILFLNRYVDNLHTAEELAEDTFVRIVTKRPRFTPNYSFKTWLYTIGRNLALTHLRQERRRSHSPIEEANLSREEETLERLYLREERKIAVHRALSRINREYAVALSLKYFEDLTNEQIAKVTRKSKRQIENLLYQAKLSLKAELKKEGFPYEGL